jgi:hypothetical protein
MIMRRLLSYTPLSRIGSGHSRYAQITKYGCPTRSLLKRARGLCVFAGSVFDDLG